MSTTALKAVGIRIDPALWRAVRARAAEEGLTVQAWLALVLRRALVARRPKAE